MARLFRGCDEDGRPDLLEARMLLDEPDNGRILITQGEFFHVLRFGLQWLSCLQLMNECHLGFEKAVVAT